MIRIIREVIGHAGRVIRGMQTLRHRGTVGGVIRNVRRRQREGATQRRYSQCNGNQVQQESQSSGHSS
jgi:hypothetical protein